MGISNDLYPGALLYTLRNPIKYDPTNIIIIMYGIYGDKYAAQSYERHFWKN